MTSPQTSSIDNSRIKNSSFQKRNSTSNQGIFTPHSINDVKFGIRTRESRAMQLSFLDSCETRLRELSRQGESLEQLNRIIDGQMFVSTLKQIDDNPRKSNAGRPLTNSSSSV
jgi:hypothetical protein